MMVTERMMAKGTDLLTSLGTHSTRDFSTVMQRMKGKGSRLGRVKDFYSCSEKARDLHSMTAIWKNLEKEKEILTMILQLYK
jgi:hypothetical protein